MLLRINNKKWLKNEPVSLFEFTNGIIMIISGVVFTVTAYNGYVIITANSDITSQWGTTYGGTVAELYFDLDSIALLRVEFSVLSDLSELLESSSNCE